MNSEKLSFGRFKNEALKVHKFRKEYEKLRPEFDLVSQLLVARKKAKISQTELAFKLHTKQPAIARFENGGFSKSSINKLYEYVDALGYELHIDLLPKTNFHHLNQ